MTTEMIVNVSPRETRAALLENGVLQELFVERASRMGLTGNLYKGRVSRVLPGMQAAFIDIGLERTAFLHVSDIVQPADAENGQPETRTDDIQMLVSEGGDIVLGAATVILAMGEGRRAAAAINALLARETSA